MNQIYFQQFIQVVKLILTFLSKIQKQKQTTDSWLIHKDDENEATEAEIS